MRRAGNILSILFFSGWLAYAQALSPATASVNDPLTELLCELGLENISAFWDESEACLIVSYENRTFRADAYAMGIVSSAVLLYADSYPPTLYLLPSYQNQVLGIYQVDLPAFSRFVQDIPEDAHHVLRMANHKRQEIMEIVQKRERRYSSTWHSDLNMNVKTLLQFGHYEDRIKCSYFFAPELHVPLGNGVSFTSEMVLPLYDEIGLYDHDVRFSSLYLNYFFVLSGDAVSAFSVGAFQPERWGVAASAAVFILDRRFLLRVNWEKTGFLLLHNRHCYYSNAQAASYALMGHYFLPKPDLDVSVGYYHSFMGDHGLRMAVDQRFNEIAIGFHFRKSNLDHGLAMHLEIPLWPLKRPNPGLIRIQHPLHYNSSLGASSRVSTLLPFIAGQEISTGIELLPIFRPLAISHLLANLHSWRSAYRYVQNRIQS